IRARSSRTRDGGPVNDAVTCGERGASRLNRSAWLGARLTWTGMLTLSRISWSRLRAYSQTSRARLNATTVETMRSIMTGFRWAKGFGTGPQRWSDLRLSRARVSRRRGTLVGRVRRDDPGGPGAGGAAGDGRLPAGVARLQDARQGGGQVVAGDRLQH